MTKQEYLKTRYIRYYPTWFKSPSNWVSGTPIRLFGRVILIRWVLAKKNYPWTNLENV